MRVAVLVLSALLLATSLVIVRSDEDFVARYAAAAEGDDPNTRGTLELEIDDGDDDDSDEIKFRAVLYNAVDVTGVHLHLEGNSSEGLFGGPLVLALTNTTQANNQQPVSSQGDQPSVQTGTRTTADLRANPQRAQVDARLRALGNTATAPETTNDLVALIRAGLVYTDVHTLERVSPAGLTRGRVAPGEVDDIGSKDTDDDDVPTSSPPASPSPSGDDGD